MHQNAKATTRNCATDERSFRVVWKWVRRLHQSKAVRRRGRFLQPGARQRATTHESLEKYKNGRSGRAQEMSGDAKPATAVACASNVPCHALSHTIDVLHDKLDSRRVNLVLTKVVRRTNSLFGSGSVAFGGPCAPEQGSTALGMLSASRLALLHPTLRRQTAML